MREILFRGMTVNGKFVEGNLSILKNDLRYSIKIDKGCYISNSCGAPFAYQVRPDTVGQFTGLVDKHGRKIFEGDLVKWFVNNKHSIGYVYFASGWFDLRGENGSICWDPIRGDSEIIGNIHDQNEDV